jgi:hypothetical protein
MKLIKDLCKKLRTYHLFSLIKNLFRNEEERVNGDARVKQLQMKFIESQQKIETLEQVTLIFSFLSIDLFFRITL